MIKDTALVYVIGLQDLMKIADGIAIMAFNPLPYLYAALFYLAMTFVLTVLLNGLEKRFAYYEG